MEITLEMLKQFQADLINKIDEQGQQQKSGLEELRSALADLDGSVGKLQSTLADLDSRVGKLQSTLADLDSRVERQDRRLAAIENFPLPPMKQPSRLYATETHSVSLPQRVRLGYAG